MAAQQQPKHSVRSEEETFWGQEWEVGATHRSTECRPGQPGWRTQLSKESPPRSPVGGGLGSEGPCRGQTGRESRQLALTLAVQWP